MQKQSPLFRTTIVIRTVFLNLLTEHADRMGIEVQDLLIKIIRRYLKKKIDNDDFAERLMKYQQRGIVWEKLHLDISPVEYDQFLDIKKVIRISFSLFIAEAIEMYLSQNDGDVVLDSYPLTMYTKQIHELNGVMVFEFAWGKQNKKLPP